MEKHASITVKFEAPYFTASGIQVRYLRIVEKSGYQALPWARCVTQNGDDYRCTSFRIDSFLAFLACYPSHPSLPTALEKGSAAVLSFSGFLTGPKRGSYRRVEA